MPLNNLRNYNWEQGTLNNPVSLDSDEINGLVKLALNSSVDSYVKGYIQPIDSISSYQEWVLNTKYPNLHLVNQIVIDESYNVVFENGLTIANIYEGNQIGIIPTNIGIEGLKFRIHSHTIVTDNIATEARIKERIHIESGKIIVDQAQENSSWSDIVIIQALPVYQEWDDGVHIPKELTLTVSAIKVSSITINSPSMAKPNSIVRGNVVLSYHTKPIITTTENDGSGIFILPKLGDNIVGKGSDGLSFNFLSPSSEGNYTVNCVLYAFDTTNPSLVATPVTLQVLQPYIQLTVTTNGTFSDISTANPKITLQKVDSEDIPIGEPIVLTGTISGSSLVYTHNNIVGDGSETYQISVEKVSGYRAQFTHKITPDDVSNNVLINYTYLVPGIYVVYNDGTEEDYDTIYSRNFRPLDNLTPKYIAVVTSTYSFVIEPLDVIITMKMCPNTTRVPNIPYTDDDMDGENNTDKIITFFGTDVEQADMYAPLMARNSKITIGGNEVRGYIPSHGQLVILKDNKTNVNNLITNTFNKAKIFPRGYSSTTTYLSDNGSIVMCIDEGGIKRTSHQNEARNIHIFYPY